MKFLKPLLSLLVAASLWSCSDNNEPKTIELPKDQPTNLTCAANTQSDQVRFTTTGSWSARVSSVARADEDIDWLTLSTTYGQAGENVLSFTLERNRTGKARTAYIIVTCQDQTIIFQITQGAEDDAEIPGDAGEGSITIHTASYSKGADGFQPDSEADYELFFVNRRLVRMESRFRDDIDNGPYGSNGDDDYSITEETFIYNYFDNFREVNGIPTAENGTATGFSRSVTTYYPSGRTEIETSDHNELTYNIGADGFPVAVSGKYMEDGREYCFDFTYNADGTLRRSRNDDGKFQTQWDNYDFSWSGGNLTGINSVYGSMAYEYTDKSLLNTIRGFDLNWALFTDFEILDFASGDPTRFWAVPGLLGTPSKNLATSVTETMADGDKSSCRLTYKTHTAEKTVVRVSRFSNNEEWGYTEWEITYHGTL